MAGVHGERLYGQVDRVPGVCYVSTMFFHIQYVPFAPKQSFIVIEGSENSAGFRGKAVPLDVKSVVIGYLRGWLGATALFCAGVCCGATTAFFLGHADGFSIAAAFSSVGIVAGLIWFILTTHSRLFLPAQGLLHAASLALLAGYLVLVAPNLALRQAKAHELRYWPFLPIANVALIGYSLTRLWTKASYDRGVELIDELGLIPKDTPDDENLEPQLTGYDSAAK
jgi:hypothetical protein